jgi:hypothetical protein
MADAVSPIRCGLARLPRFLLSGGNDSCDMLGGVDDVWHGALSVLSRSGSADWLQALSLWLQAFWSITKEGGSEQNCNLPSNQTEIIVETEACMAYEGWAYVAWVVIGLAVTITLMALIDEASLFVACYRVPKAPQRIWGAFVLPQTFEKLYALYLERMLCSADAKEEARSDARHLVRLGASLARLACARLPYCADHWCACFANVKCTPRASRHPQCISRIVRVLSHGTTRWNQRRRSTRMTQQAYSMRLP